MGYLRHECIVVSGWDEKRVKKAHAKAIVIFSNYDMDELVGPVIPHTTNGGAAFLIAPDGSKEGWGPSDKGDEARAEFIEWLKNAKAAELYLDWALVLIGGDDGEYRVLNSPSGGEAPAVMGNQGG